MSIDIFSLEEEFVLNSQKSQKNLKKRPGLKKPKKDLDVIEKNKALNLDLKNHIKSGSFNAIDHLLDSNPDIEIKLNSSLKTYFLSHPNFNIKTANKFLDKGVEFLDAELFNGMKNALYEHDKINLNIFDFALENNDNIKNNLLENISDEVLKIHYLKVDRKSNFKACRLKIKEHIPDILSTQKNKISSHNTLLSNIVYSFEKETDEMKEDLSLLTGKDWWGVFDFIYETNSKYNVAYTKSKQISSLIKFLHEFPIAKKGMDAYFENNKNENKKLEDFLTLAETNKLNKNQFDIWVSKDWCGDALGLSLTDRVRRHGVFNGQDITLCYSLKDFVEVLICSGSMSSESLLETKNGRDILFKKITENPHCMKFWCMNIRAEAAKKMIRKVDEFKEWKDKNGNNIIHYILVGSREMGENSFISSALATNYKWFEDKNKAGKDLFDILELTGVDNNKIISLKKSYMKKKIMMEKENKTKKKQTRRI